MSRRYDLNFLKSGYIADYKSKYWSTVPSWTSIYTGLTQEEHGCPPGWKQWLYNQVRVKERLNTPDTLHRVNRLVFDTDGPIQYPIPYRSLPFIWKLLNHQGKTTGIFRMPLTFPAHKVRGWMVSGFPAVNSMMTRTTTRIAYPLDAAMRLEDFSPDILQRLDPEFITHFKKPEDLSGHAVTADMIIEHIKNGIHNLKILLAWYKPDVLFVGYSFLDHIGHIQIVKEEDHEALYKMVDWAISETMALTETEASMIVSDHGGIVMQKQWGHTEDAVFWMTEKPDQGTLYEYDVTRHILRLAKQFT